MCVSKHSGSTTAGCTQLLANGHTAAGQRNTAPGQRTCWQRTYNCWPTDKQLQANGYTLLQANGQTAAGQRTYISRSTHIAARTSRLLAQHAMCSGVCLRSSSVSAAHPRPSSVLASSAPPHSAAQCSRVRPLASLRLRSTAASREYVSSRVMYAPTVWSYCMVLLYAPTVCRV